MAIYAYKKNTHDSAQIWSGKGRADFKKWKLAKLSFPSPA